ncbi:MAG: 2Fe-2S iron-sulfur cluster-binding protein [Nocardioides sp.]
MSTLLVAAVEHHGGGQQVPACWAVSIIAVVRPARREVTMLHNEVLDDEHLADGIRLACQSQPVSDSVRISYP